MNTLMLATLGLPEVVVILLVLLLLAVVAGGIVALALTIVTLLKKSRQSATAQPPALDPASTNCPRCGATLPTNSPQGLCPRCVMGVGLVTQTEAPGEIGPQGTKVITPTPTPEDVARHFPQLEILGCLGRGGMGVVYKARQPKLNRLVALKILAPDKGAEPKFAERFLREAQALARLSHPNIITVHDYGEADGLFYLLMEYVDGVNLRQLLREGRMKPEQALRIVPRICEALQFAHEQGVVHRDIKPENVLLDRQGRVKIADFGIAKIVGAEQPRPTLTEERSVIGTPHYMAPEQVEHPQLVDHRADIYSLGVVFYEMLTGELPLGKFQPPSRKVQVDVRFDEVVLHALEKEPERRYQHASDVQTDVESIRSGTPTARAPAAASVCRIPGTNVALIESQNGQRHVYWPGVCLAWIFLMIAGGACLGLVGLVARGLGYSIPPETPTNIGLGMAVVAAFSLTVYVRRALFSPTSEVQAVEIGRSAAAHAAPDADALARARELLKWPATGLTAIGLCFPVVIGLFLAFDHWPQDWQGVFGLMGASGIPWVILHGSHRMRHLQNYRMAVLGAVTGLIVALPALPLAAFPIWALMALYRPDVRTAFRDQQKTGTPAASGVASSAAAVGGVAMALLLVVATVQAWRIHQRNRANPEQVSADAVARVEEKLRREILQRLAESGWKPEGLSVSVSPNLQRAECRFGRVSKGGLFREPPYRAAIRLIPRGGGLWLVRGEDEFHYLRFSVSTSAETGSAGGATVPFRGEAELTLNDLDEQGELLDLDARQILKLDGGYHSWPREQQAKWLEDHSVDLMLDHVEQWGLITPQRNAVRLVRIADSLWEGGLPIERFDRELSRTDPGLQTLARRDITVYLLGTNATPPLTFAYQTAGGSRGLLRIVQFTQKPNSARLRLKHL